MSAADHPLNAADAERSRARLADIELGLSDPLDAHYWRDKLERRIHALEEDGESFGLVAHEERELEALKKLQSRQEAGDRRRGSYASSSPPPSREARHG